MLDAGPDHRVFIMLNPGLDHCKGKLTGMLSTNSIPMDCEWDFCSWVKAVRIIPKFRILRLTFHRIQDFEA